MRDKKKLLVEQLDNKLNVFHKVEQVLVPPAGWLKTIRTTLSMTLEQFGSRLKTTKQAAKRLEDREVNGTITLNSLREAGKALEMKLVYGFVPNDGTIDNLITKKAEKLAQIIVLRTNQNMRLENQGIDQKKINDAISELAQELKREMKKSLWD
jgi:predicted DNA-binding mobile mystery protein A